MKPWPYPALLFLLVVGCVVTSCAPKAQQVSFDIKGHSVFKDTTKEDTALSPEERRCIKRRFALLHRLGGKEVTQNNISNFASLTALYTLGSIM